jgi:hypothetical protein
MTSRCQNWAGDCRAFAEAGEVCATCRAMRPMPLAEADDCCGQMCASDFHLRPPCENCPLIEPEPGNCTLADFVMMTTSELASMMGIVPLMFESPPCAGYSVAFDARHERRRRALQAGRAS